MISPIGVNSAALSVSSILQTTSSSAAAAASGLSLVGAGGDSAEVSGPGRLFAALKELAAQDPAKFQAVTADIATKLTAAAGQSGDSTTTAAAGVAGGANAVLTDLAAKFEQAASTGDVSALQPSSHHHHRSHGVGTYNQHGQVSPPTPPADAANGVDLKALFTSITNEVTAALSS